MKPARLRFLLPALACALLVLLLAGCSSKKEDPYAMPPPLPADSPDKVVWNEAKGAISLILEAADDSNLIDGTGHATSICIMQVPDADKLKAMGQDADGIRALLACRPAPPDIIAARQFYVQPGTHMTLVMDRVEGARHIAVVAGFNSLSPEACLATVPIPVHQGSERSFLVFSHPVYSAAAMKLAVTLNQATMAVQGVERED